MIYDKSPKEELFHFLYVKYYDKVCFFARSYVQNAEDAREIAQNVFMRLWEMMPQINPELNVQALLLTMARNQCLNLLRHKVYKQKYAYSRQEQAQLQVNIDALSDHTFDRLLMLEIQELTDAALKTMPQKIRDTYVLSRNDHLSNKEIADRCGISLKSVEYRINRALAVLRKILIDYVPIVAILFFNVFMVVHS